MKGRAPLLLVLVVAAIVGGAGCRDLVGPEAVGQLGPHRPVEGRLLGLEGFDVPTARITFDTRPYTDPYEDGALWSIETDGGPSFDFALARGTDTLADVMVTWLEDTELVRHVFAQVPLRGAVMELDYDARRIEGRIDWPEGFDGALFAGTDVILRRYVRPDRSLIRHELVHITDVPLQADGSFAGVLPGDAWTVQIVNKETDLIADLNVVWRDVDLDPSVTLDPGLELRPMRCTVPDALPAGTEAEFFLRGPTPTVSPETTHRFEADGRVVERWIPENLHSWAIDVFLPSGGEVRVIDHDVFGSTWTSPIAETDTLTWELGEVTLRVEVVDDGVAVEDASIRVWYESTWYDRDDSPASGAWYALDRGPVRIDVEHEGRFRRQELLLKDDRVVRIDLSEVSTEDAP
jgi:hypothetical protein